MCGHKRRQRRSRGESAGVGGGVLYLQFLETVGVDGHEKEDRSRGKHETLAFAGAFKKKTRQGGLNSL